MSAPVSLKAMAEAKADGVQKATYFKVHPSVVEFEEGFNLREEGPELDAHLEAMYVAMKAGASFPPIDVSVVDGRIIARDGHCRTRTAKRLADEGIEYLLEARQFRGNEVECVFHMLGTGNGSKNYTPLESGRGYLRLIRYGQDVPAIAARMGVSRTTIENGLILAEAPIAIQQMISAGKVAAHVAIDMIRKHGSKAAEMLEAALDRSGKTKVTSKHVSDRVPPKVARAMVDGAAAIRNAIGERNVNELLHGDVGDRLIMVPAAALKTLIEAHAGLSGDTKTTTGE